jgi:hypothetical protein
MRRTCAFVSTLVLAAAAHAGPRQAPARHELPYQDCIRTDIINEWNIVNDRTITVRNGPHYFLVRTSTSCPRADLGGALLFRPSNSQRVVGGSRICGGINEQIVRRSDPPCQIQSVQVIDKAQFDQLKKQAQRHGNPAAPSGAVR